MWRARFGRGFRPVVRRTTKWMNATDYARRRKNYKHSFHLMVEASDHGCLTADICMLHWICRQKIQPVRETNTCDMHIIYSFRAFFSISSSTSIGVCCWFTSIFRFTRYLLYLSEFCVLNTATGLVSVIIVARYGDAITVF